MEQPSYNNAVLNNTSDPFINGRPLAASGSSSSTTSSNGTPSHSYKGSFSPSSPSSDDLSSSNDNHNKQSNQLPFDAAVSLSEQVTSSKLFENHPVRSQNIVEPLIQLNYMNNVQSTDRLTGPAFNQNMYRNVADNLSNFDTGSNLSSNNSQKNIIANVKDSQIESPVKLHTQSSSQLPNITNHAPTPNITSFFKNVNMPNSTDFPSQENISAKVPYQSSASNFADVKDDYSKPVEQIHLPSHQNYISNVTPQNTVFNHSQNVLNEQSTQFKRPEIFKSHTNSPSAFAQFSRPTSGAVISQQPSVQPSSQIPMPQPSSYLQQQQQQQQPQPPQFLIPQNAMPSSGSIFPLKNAKSAIPSVMNPTSTSYQNVSLYQNSQSFHSNQSSSSANRSQLQSPLSNKSNMSMSGNQGIPNIGNQNFSNMTNQMFSNYGIQNQQAPSSNISQPRSNNRMYQMNGHQNMPLQGPGYGTQFQPIPQQLTNRYPGSAVTDVHQVDSMSKQFGGLSVTKQGFYGMQGIESCDLLRIKDILPKQRIQAPSIHLPPELPSDCNCNPDVFRSTLTKIPETKALLEKSRLPLGILLHPFRDLTDLSVIQCSTIVRCRACRTYINPFVYFMDNRHWKCNLCFRANELPDDFRYNPLTKMHDDPLRRPEVKNATIEFIASSEYMVRPPQPAVYLFIFDISRIATQTGYLSTVCEILSANLNKLPGDSRTSVGFIAVDSAVRFYDLGENLSHPHELIVTDVDDVFIPSPENLIVNLHEQYDLIKDLLEQIPVKFKDSYDTNFALGAALQAAHKLMAPTGGRVTVFVSCLPNYGPGALKPREEPIQRTSNKDIPLNPVTDFYKKLALECNGQYVAIDLFLVNAQFVDLATISGISQISGGCINHFPLYSSKNSKDVEKLMKTFERYLTRKIGFEAVMRLRCTKGLSIHSFHGNFFVRTTDLLALPNINPDAGFGMQISINENLSDMQSVSFQAALLYTSSKGERRIRVHTLCLPVTNNLHDVLVSADQQCITGLLAKMAVDRSLHSSVADAREAFVNVVCDILNAYKMVSSIGHAGSLFVPNNLVLFPLYILGLMKSIAFRLGQSTRTDDRVYSMYQMKCIPLDRLIQIVHPDLYAIHNLSEQDQFEIDGKIVPMPPILQLSAEHVDSRGVYLLDEDESIIIFICHNVTPVICQNLFGCPQFSSISENMDNLPVIETQENQLVHRFLDYLQFRKSISVPVYILKDSVQFRNKFYEKLIEDKTELGVSYYEFLQNVRSQSS
ncbi:hypothetical protein PGB90_002394 [Kerria lacca]